MSFGEELCDMTELDLIINAIKNIKTYGEVGIGRFAKLSELLKIAILICDRKGQIVFANQSGLNMLQANAFEVLNLQLTDVLQHSGPGLIDRMKSWSNSLGVLPFDDFLTDAQGIKQRVSLLVHPLDLVDSGAMYVLMVVVPETQRTALYKAFSGAGATQDYLVNFLLLAQDAERKRIASDLHDGLGQVLTMMKFRVENALMQLDVDKAATITILKEVIGQLRGAVGEVRRISTELRPAMLDDLGLLHTLQWFCKQFEAAHTGIHVTFDNKLAEEDIPIQIKIPMFRLIQEAMNNVVKHADASKVSISLRIDHGGLLVAVTDNGVGFDSDRAGVGATCLLGIGLNSMRERIEAAHGVFHIRSHAGSGTAISAVWRLGKEVSRKACPSWLENEVPCHIETPAQSLKLN
jgi:two-component system, NarL family, sensor kinase